MFKSNKNVSQNKEGSAIYKKKLPSKLISFSLVLALMLSTLAFNPNAGPPTLAAEETQATSTTPTTLWNGLDEPGYSFADLSNFIESNGKNGFKEKTPKEGTILMTKKI